MAETDDTVTLDLVGARLLALTAECAICNSALPEWRRASARSKHALPQRWKARFTSFEGRFAVQEERMTRLLALVVRIAERVGTPAD